MSDVTHVGLRPKGTLHFPPEEPSPGLVKETTRQKVNGNTSESAEVVTVLRGGKKIVLFKQFDTLQDHLQGRVGVFMV